VHNVSPGELSAYIQQLEQACLDNPRSAELRTCLGMAHAVNYDVYKSMDALEDARAVDPENFWAQLKYAELHYRLGQDLLKKFPGCEEHSVVARAAMCGVPIYTSSPGDSSIGMNIAYHALLNESSLMIDPNQDVNEVCAIILAGHRNGCVILGGGSPKNFYLQAQPTLWEVYGIPKGGNDYFIQITTDSVVWGGLSGATPAEAVSWGKVNPGVLPDTVVAYCDSTIAFPLFCEYAVGSPNGRRTRKELVHKRDELVANLTREAKAAHKVRSQKSEVKS
jgi:deoxyhypusine synthase